MSPGERPDGATEDDDLDFADVQRDQILDELRAIKLPWNPYLSD